jgi:hypothetical protein
VEAEPETFAAIRATSWCLFGVYFYRVPERITRMDRPNGKVLGASVDGDVLTLR